MAENKDMKITYEMAKDIGLIERPSKRYYGWFPFMSAYGVEVRDREQNNGFEAEEKRIQQDYCDKDYLVNVELNKDGFPIRAIKINYFNK